MCFLISIFSKKRGSRFQGHHVLPQAAMCWLTLLSLGHSEDFVQQQDEPGYREQRFLKDYWTPIQAAGLQDNIVLTDESEQQLDIYWSDVVDVGIRSFDAMAADHDWERNIQFYVKQFGKHGPQSDFRWLVANPAITLPFNLYKPKSLKYQKLRNIQLLLAEEFTIRLLSDSKLLDRYTHSVIWYGGLFDDRFFPIYVRHMIAAFQKEESAEFWWHARNYVVIANAMGRGDLVNGTTPEDLREKGHEWFGWIEENGPYLRASTTEPAWFVDIEDKRRKLGYVPFTREGKMPHLLKPLNPFPDWQGTPPPPAKFVHSLL